MRVGAPGGQGDRRLCPPLTSGRSSAGPEEPWPLHNRRLGLRHRRRPSTALRRSSPSKGRSRPHRSVRPLPGPRHPVRHAVPCLCNQNRSGSHRHLARSLTGPVEARAPLAARATPVRRCADSLPSALVRSPTRSDPRRRRTRPSSPLPSSDRFAAWQPTADLSFSLRSTRSVASRAPLPGDPGSHGFPSPMRLSQPTGL